MIRETNNKKLVDAINKKLDENFEKYGARYCPCRIFHTEETICPCKEFREQESGTCHCGKLEKIV